MSKARLEAFSDGVIAILITIMVLELKIPPRSDWEALREVASSFSTYALSFVFVGIYWNNHHHMLHAAHRVNGKVLWANLHLLFWLSIVPFVTGWMGETHLAQLPTAVYGMILCACAIAYTILQMTLIAAQGDDSLLARAVGRDYKGKLSLVLYVIAVGAAFLHTWISAVIFASVSLIWLVPDRRIERTLGA